jgi:hypothetical protein
MISRAIEQEVAQCVIPKMTTSLGTLVEMKKGGLIK